MLDKKLIDYFFDAYLPNKVNRLNPEASPLLSENRIGLPPAFVITAEFDPLLDEGKAYS